MKLSKKMLRVFLIISITVGLCLGAEFFSFLVIKYKTQWFQSWEYITIPDPDLGFRLRPGIEVSLNDFDNACAFNQSGLRDRTTDVTVSGKQDDELLIFVIGDSNTFGYKVDYDDTFAMQLQRMLAGQTNQNVRVVNFGVFGYTSLQAEKMLARWIKLKPDIIVFTECFNDRVYSPVHDDTKKFVRDFRQSRFYELDGYICYSLLLVHKLLNRTKVPVSLLTLEQELPASRISPEKYRNLLTRMVVRAKDHNARLIFVATGDDNTFTDQARIGLGHYRSKNFDLAEQAFSDLINRRATCFINWYYYYNAYIRSRDIPREERIIADFEKSVSQNYINQFVRYSFEYVLIMEVVAARENHVSFLDMRDRFSLEGVDFLDICHYHKKGHRLIAESLCSLIQNSRQENQAVQY